MQRPSKARRKMLKLVSRVGIKRSPSANNP
uniref:Uncharacterized protein n=1 Tax=Klebsiella phage FKP3 TaxID=3231233 RepID=A0AAU8HZL8_9CAUD